MSKLNRQPFILGQRSDEYGRTSQGRLSSTGMAHRDFTAMHPETCSTTDELCVRTYLGRTIDMGELAEIDDVMNTMGREEGRAADATIVCNSARLMRSSARSEVEQPAICHVGPRRSATNSELEAPHRKCPRRSGTVGRSTAGTWVHCWTCRACRTTARCWTFRACCTNEILTGWGRH